MRLLVMAVAVMLAAPAARADLSEGLVAYWSFDEGSGSIAHDSSGYGNHGTVFGASWVEGVSGNALCFDGSDDYVEVPDSVSLRPGQGSWSIAGYFYLTDAEQIAGLVVKRQAATPYEQYSLFVAGDSHGGTVGRRVCFLYRTSDTQDRAVRTLAEYATGCWRHIAVVSDSATDRLGIYIDGAEVPIVAEYWAGPWPVIDNTDPLRLAWLGIDYPSAFFLGVMDEVQIYNRALEDDEIEYLYQHPGNPVSLVTASQRPDASKLVDVDYALGGEDDPYTITVAISSDGGNTWDIDPGAVSGDAGEGVEPGEDKHIVWNPAVDIPGVSGDNFKVRVTADGVYYADSNVFSIVAAGPGDVLGTVRDQTTGDPVIEAEVSLNGGEPVQTDEFGFFAFSAVPAGQATIAVSKAGYYHVTQSVTVREDSFTSVQIVLTPDVGFGVSEVRGLYCGPGKRAYFLNGVWAAEMFTATVDWEDHPPGSVHWIKSNDPNNPIVDPCPGTTVSRSFNVGTAFGNGGTLSVVAVTGDNPPVESVPYPVNFGILPLPPIADMIASVTYVAMPSGEGLEYRIAGLQGGKIDLANWGASQVDTSIPLFGGQELKVSLEIEEDPSPFSATLQGTVNTDGKATLYTFGWDDSKKKYLRKGIKATKGMKLPYVQFGASASFELDFYWSDDWEAWMPGGEFSLGCNFKHSSPQVTVGVIPVIFVPIYLRAEQSLDLTATVGVYGWTTEGPVWLGEFAFEPLMKGIVGAGLADWACVEGYAGGGLHVGAQFLPEFEWANPYIIIVVGVQATLGPFTIGPFELKHCWPEACDDKLLGLDELVRGGGWVLLPRDYLKYREFGARERGPTLLRDGYEAPVPGQVAVYPYSTPDVAAVTDGVLAAWVADNTRRDLINRTEVQFAVHDEGGWSEAAAVASDGTADLNPRLVSLPDGDAVCIWQGANAVLSDTDPMEVFLSHLEISVATYDADTGTWSAPTRLTDDEYMDRSPNIAAVAAEDMLAVWVSNTANDMWGTIDLPNDILWSAYDGVEWTAPAMLASGFGTILDMALAYDGTGGTLVFCTDADDDLDTSEDQELWAATYTGGVWSTPAQLTSDTVCDADPHLASDTGGTLWLVWLKGDDIRFAEGLDVDNSAVVVTPHESMGSKDFDLVMGLTGRIALVWNDTSETYHDIWVSYFELTQEAWSQPRQLTFDDYAERFMASVFDASDDLFCVYDKTETLYADREEWVGGQLVTVEDVPEPGQSDLYYLTYHMDGDLAVFVEDVSVTPPNPLPVTQATITAKVKNVGESPASSIEVGFYDGDPDAGGVLIGTMPVVAGPLVGGGEAEASVEWVVPAVTEPVEIYVRVDPNLVQEDRDRMNNMTSFWVLAPDIAVAEVIVQAAGPHRIITTRVENRGSLPVADVDLVLRRDAIDGEVLATFAITEPLVAGAYCDVSWTWENVIPIVGGWVDVFVIADEGDAIDELDEDNNVRSTTLTNPPPAYPGDWDHDGDVDINDFAEFPGCMSGPWGAPDWVMPSQACRDAFDFDADADVDLADFASFQRAFDGGSP
ncbi:MAG: carboxypeptidase regulatory-like domain-containing protein [Planctomycetes bacterium]|nr:carboxypeptidase regulatory-like domain-containing protein [Planctomycetota bacterium]